MHWNHRVVIRLQEFCDPLYEIREVYYRDDGSIEAWTAGPLRIMGDNVIEIRETLKRLLRALDTPVLTEKKVGRKVQLVPYEQPS